jgi:hypothetical protein
LIDSLTAYISNAIEREREREREHIWCLVWLLCFLNLKFSQNEGGLLTIIQAFSKQGQPNKNLKCISVTLNHKINPHLSRIQLGGVKNHDHIIRTTWSNLKQKNDIVWI